MFKAVLLLIAHHHGYTAKALPLSSQQVFNSGVDPMDPLELLSYLEQPDYNTPPSSGASSQGQGAGNTPAGAGLSSAPDTDDILALFD